MDALKRNMAIIISAAAFIVSAVSLYLTVLQGANITLAVGDELGISYKDNQLYFFLPVVVQNTGARPGIILCMSLIIKDQKSEDAICIKWQSFSVQIYDSYKREFTDIDESHATAVSILARSNITKKATFSGGGSIATWIPKQSTYDLYLLWWTSETKEPSLISCKSTWTFDKDAVSNIKLNSENHTDGNTYIIRSAYGPGPKMLSTSEFNKLIK
jgi:hypothetical protein